MDNILHLVHSLCFYYKISRITINLVEVAKMPKNVGTERVNGDMTGKQKHSKLIIDNT